MADDGVVQRWLSLQPDMYGWMLSTMSTSTSFNFEVFVQTLLWLVNICLQLFFVQCVRWMNFDFVSHSNSCECTLLIQWAAVFFWELEMWSEITETLDMLELLYYTPNDRETAGSIASAVTCGGDHTNEAQLLATESTGVPQDLVPQGIVHADIWSPQACLAQIWSGQLQLAQKMVFVSLVLLPKLVIALMLSHVGGVYIFLSKADEVVILSVVAAEFVLRIDEMFFTSFAMPEISILMRRAQPIGYRMDSMSLWTRWRTSKILCMIIDPWLVMVLAYSVIVAGVDDEQCPSEEQWWL